MNRRKEGEKAREGEEIQRRVENGKERREEGTLTYKNGG